MPDMDRIQIVPRLFSPGTAPGRLGWKISPSEPPRTRRAPFAKGTRRLWIQHSSLRRRSATAAASHRYAPSSFLSGLSITTVSSAPSARSFL
jgi:hypothetical protein